MSYKFEDIDDSSISLDPQKMASATAVLFPLLAHIATNNDREKIEELYKLFDLALEWNKETTCHDQIALIAKSTKFFLDGND
ncbi:MULTISPECIES: hypothetical protein [Providencia]|uniref:hypothetical protein n=1 Tax=Providencia TaxID=586 RepID=UPI0015EB4D01|nr:MULTISPECIES: hypothetical protein [Providencia]MDL9981745.1 hypothetical protein [Providencia rettgeri]QLQ96024.1 hypothetical protein H0910_10215 [Providencia alcalifaciens]